MAFNAGIATRPGGFAFLLALCLALSLPTPSSADQLLANGDFESGPASWAGSGFSANASCARSGALGGLLTSTVDNDVPMALQYVGPAGPGTYTLRGYARLAPGAQAVPAFRVSLRSYTATAPLSPAQLSSVSLSANWTAFSVTLTEASSQMSRIRTDITAVASSPTAVCFDDVTLEGPALSTLTPTPTPSPTATETPLPTQTPTTTPTASPTSATASATASPTTAPTVVPTSTATGTASTTASPTRTATPIPVAVASAAPSFTFINGGFEDGTAGWQKFGGELHAVATPRESGDAAGLLKSETSSTKWAFQPVRIDPALTYELSGAVLPVDDGSVAYLRISWYESSDAGGAAVATDDSTTRVTGPATGFVRLTTGPRTPPHNAQSARLRIVLAPADASASLLYIDNVSFEAVSTASTQVPSAVATAAPDEPVEPPAIARRIEPTARPAATTSAAVTRTSTARVVNSTTAPSRTPTTAAAPDAVSFQQLPTTAATVSVRPFASDDVVEPREGDRSLSWPMVAGSVVAFALAGAVAFVWARRSQRASV